MLPLWATPGGLEEGVTIGQRRFRKGRWNVTLYEMPVPEAAGGSPSQDRVFYPYVDCWRVGPNHRGVRDLDLRKIRILRWIFFGREFHCPKLPPVFRETSRECFQKGRKGRINIDFISYHPRVRIRPSFRNSGIFFLKREEGPHLLELEFTVALFPPPLVVSHRICGGTAYFSHLGVKQGSGNSNASCQRLFGLRRWRSPHRSHYTMTSARTLGIFTVLTHPIMLPQKL